MKHNRNQVLVGRIALEGEMVRSSTGTTRQPFVYSFVSRLQVITTALTLWYVLVSIHRSVVYSVNVSPVPCHWQVVIVVVAMLIDPIAKSRNRTISLPPVKRRLVVCQRRTKLCRKVASKIHELNAAKGGIKFRRRFTTSIPFTL